MTRVAGALLALAAVAVVGYAGLNLAGGILVDRFLDEDGIACDEFEFSREDWLDKPEGGWYASGTITERERIADAFFRCQNLRGRQRAEVRAMLGRGWESKDGSKESYDIGLVNDGIGPGDGWAMTLVYDERGRVARTLHTD